MHLGTTLGQDSGPLEPEVELELGSVLDSELLPGAIPAGEVLPPAGLTVAVVATTALPVEMVVLCPFSEALLTGLVSAGETEVAFPVSVAVTGKIVVEIAMVFVTTE